MPTDALLVHVPKQTKALDETCNVGLSPEQLSQLSKLLDGLHFDMNHEKRKGECSQALTRLSKRSKSVQSLGACADLERPVSVVCLWKDETEAQRETRELKALGALGSPLHLLTLEAQEAAKAASAWVRTPTCSKA